MLPAHRAIGVIVCALLVPTLAACVEQTRTPKKFGRTFESGRTRASMPFEFAPVPEGRWVDPSTQWEINAAPDLSGIKPGSGSSGTGG